MRSGLRACWILLLALALAVGARAQPSADSAPAPVPLQLEDRPGAIELVAQARFWIDESSTRTAEQLAERADDVPWQPRRQEQQYRLDGQVLWIHFSAITLPQARWFLQVGSAAVDRVELHYRDAQGQWVRQQAGDHVPLRAWPIPGRLPTLPLASDTGREPVQYWLRVEHSRFDFAAPVRLVEQGTLLAERDVEQFLLGGYFGLAALIALAALGNGLLYRDRGFLAYAVYVTLLAGGQLVRLGIGYQHLWPEAVNWNEASSFVLPVLSTSAALWFVKVATEPARFSMKLDLATWALIAAGLAALAVDAVVTTRTSLNLVLAIIVLTVLAMAGLIGTAWIVGRDRDARLLALGFLPVIVLALFPIARGFNLLPTSMLTRYGAVIGALLEMPILYYALSVRMARRREGDVRAKALPHTDTLTGLAHRGALLSRLGTTLHRAATQRQCCALLAVRIANLPAIEEEFGEDAVEKSLVVAASHLRRAAADIDLAARAGDNAFVLLVETPTSRDVAMSRAQQLVASGLRPAEALPPGVTLKFHVTVALLPHGQADAEASLQWAVDGLSMIAPDARKLIRPLNFA